MPFTINDYADFRQRVNYSNKAWNIIQEDYKDFDLCKSEFGLLNRIFINFYEAAEASIMLRLEELRKNCNPNAWPYVVDMKKRELREKINSYPKDFSKAFKVQKKSCEILEDSDEDAFYGDYIGDYFKAIYEEYAAKNRFEREKIYYKDIVKDINYAISDSKMVDIKLFDLDEHYSFIPLRIVNDSKKLFNYIIGLMDNKLVGFMLNNIKSIKLLKKEKVNYKLNDLLQCIDDNEITLIDSRISKKQNHFILKISDLESIIINLVSIN